MKIGIDARMMGAGNTRGIGRYIEELVRAMIKVAPENEYVLVTRTADHALKDHDCIKTIVADIPWYGAKEQFYLPGILMKLNTDVFHFPHWNVPLAYRRPFAVTIHDLLLKHQINSSKASTRSWPVRVMKSAGYNACLSHAIKDSRKIFVPSEFVRDDIISFYPQCEEKITVTAEGTNVSVTRDQGTVTRDRTKPYLLYVGSAYPHKRVDLILQAWKSIKNDYPDMELRVAGEMDIFMRGIKDGAEAMNLKGIHFEGKVSEQRLTELYTGAMALLFSSEFEGFGLPPVEALASECPVICSDLRPMTDNLGDEGVIYFKSGSVNGMIQAVKTVVDNSDLMRNQAKKAGEKIKEKFSWKQTAKITLEAYKKSLI
ncbi:MAG: glycosyltransferase family 4 protein [Patescibacteria group bacterium]